MKKVLLVAAATLLASCSTYQDYAPSFLPGSGAVSVKLSGAEEVPPVTVPGSGSGTIRVNSDGTGSGCVTFSAITSPLQTFSAACEAAAAVIIRTRTEITNASERCMRAVISPRNRPASFVALRSKGLLHGLVSPQRSRLSRSD